MDEPRVLMTLAEAALTRSWRTIRGLEAFGITTHPSYVSKFSDNLISRAEPRDFEEDVRRGQGHELDWYNNGRSPPRFHAAYSSTALAVNTFSPFRRQIADLAIFDLRGFTALSFEAKLPTGVSTPNIDVLCEGRTVLVIEAKCLEYLRRGETADVRRSAKKVPFSTQYLRTERLLDNKFGELYKEINTDFGAFAPVGVAQIVKHYLGIKNSRHQDRPAILGYLFWEPSDHEQYPVFAHHRKQIAAVGDLLRGSSVRFHARSYAELWQEMLARAPASWVADHVAELRRRYDIPLKPI